MGDDDRLFRVFMYMRDPANPSEVDSNHYAFPLAISPVIHGVTLTLARIEYLPTGADNSTAEPPKPWTSKPANEYIPEHHELRKDLKPLQVVQPDGASFTVTNVGETGHTLAWQKWTFRVGFNHREGVVLYDVRYEGRPLFYRVSLSDMNIPYADPRHPYNKKSAFDLGDAGAGTMANDLKLGCDCLGSIYYLDGWISDASGEAVKMPNAVCIHEQDGGISWKHTNYRTGRAAVVRSRELVVQSIITVANYEYILAFLFNQAGEFSYEVRATGILSTQPIDEGVSVPYGTVVHPGVLAVHHQHIFSLRVDPMIDGLQNRLVYEEAHALPYDSNNVNGNGYATSTTVVEKSQGLQLDASANRVFKIQNATHRNPINNLPVAYKIQAPDFQKILSHPNSLNYKRAEFSSHNIFVTQHRDRELYSGGWYTNQSRGDAGVRTWATRADNVKDDDIVVWVQFGLNHVPRIEDFPVMPAEKISVHFKPVNFFTKNPALDVPPSTQSFNQSVLLSEGHKQGSLTTTVGENGKVNGTCCDGEAAQTNGVNGTNGVNNVNGH